MDFGDGDILQKVSEDMAEIHLSIDTANTQFLAVERRHNYSTAKSRRALALAVTFSVRRCRKLVNFGC